MVAVGHLEGFELISPSRFTLRTDSRKEKRKKKKVRSSKEVAIMQNKILSYRVGYFRNNFDLWTMVHAQGLKEYTLISRYSASTNNVFS